MHVLYCIWRTAEQCSRGSKEGLACMLRCGAPDLLGGLGSLWVDSDAERNVVLWLWIHLCVLQVSEHGVLDVFT